MSSTSNRVATKQYLRDLLRSSLNGVAVDYSRPRLGVENRHVYLGGIETIQWESGRPMQAGRKQRNDVFKLSLIVSVYVEGVDTGEEPDVQVERIWSQIDSLLADPTIAGAGPKLGGNVPGLLHAVIDNVDGPFAYPPRDPETNAELPGYASEVLIEIKCESRLT